MGQASPERTQGTQAKEPRFEIDKNLAAMGACWLRGPRWAEDYAVAKAKGVRSAVKRRPLKVGKLSYEV